MGVPTFNSDEILGFSTTPETKERNSVPLSLQSEIVSSPPGVRREFPGSAAAVPMRRDAVAPASPSTLAARPWALETGEGQAAAWSTGPGFNERCTS